MNPPDPAPAVESEFIERLRASLQADENDEAVYGWMVEEFAADLPARADEDME